MTPRRQPDEDALEEIVRPGTVLVQPKNAPSYIRCDSREPFMTQSLSADQVNQQLNLNLGQSIITPENKALLWSIRFLDSILIEWWEPILFKLSNQIPLVWRRKLTFMLWNLYFPVHKLLLGRKTGIHPDASLEYHAITTILWWARLFPVSIRRIRFSLSQLTVWTPNPQVSRTEHIQEPCPMDDIVVPNAQKGWEQISGALIHTAQVPTEYTIFWLYGGAFLAGDVEGNIGPAEWIGRQCEMDVFLPSYRLAPEAYMDDFLWDVCLAYRWLCGKRDPSKIILFGVSSGAGLCARLMQSIAETTRGEPTLPPYLATVLPQTQPTGAVLFGAFVDYTNPPGSFQHYNKHDLIVNQRVMEYTHYLESHISDPKAYSPVYRSFVGCAPICVIVSEHEVVYDQAVLLVNRARQEGVSVTVGQWKYMCHVWCFLSGFIPEGQQSMEFTVEWMRNLAFKKHDSRN